MPSPQVTQVDLKNTSPGGGVGGPGVTLVSGGNIGLQGPNPAVPNNGTGIRSGAQNISLSAGGFIQLPTLNGNSTATFTDLPSVLTPAMGLDFVVAYQPNHFVMTWANANFPANPAAFNAAAYLSAEAAASQMIVRFVLLPGGTIWITNWIGN